MQTGAGHLFILHSFSSLCLPQWNPFFLCLSHLYSNRSLDCSQIRFASADKKTSLYHTTSCPLCHSCLFFSLSFCFFFYFKSILLSLQWTKKNPNNFWKRPSMWWSYTCGVCETSSLTRSQFQWFFKLWYVRVPHLFSVIKITNCRIWRCKVVLQSWGITSADVSTSGSVMQKQDSRPHLFRKHFPCISSLLTASTQVQPARRTLAANPKAGDQILKNAVLTCCLKPNE